MTGLIAGAVVQHGEADDNVWNIHRVGAVPLLPGVDE